MKARQKWIITVSLVFFALLFVWYFLFYVNNRKEMLNEQGYRTLGQLAQNLNAKINSYRNSINYYNMAGLQVERLKILAEEVDTSLLSGSASQAGSGYCYIDEQQNRLVLNELEGSDSCKVRRYSIPFEHLMENLLNNTFFQEMMIISRFTGGEKPRDKIVFQTSSPPFFIENQDSLFSNSNGFFKSEIHTVELAGKTYKVFYYPSSVGTRSNNSRIVLAGLVELQQFNRKAYQVGTWLIILLSIFIMLIVFSLPLIKLMLMNAMERIYLHNVVLTITGIMLGSAAMILLILNLGNYFRSSNQIDKNLVALSDNISDGFNQELDSILTLLNTSGELLKTIREFQNDFKDSTITEIDTTYFQSSKRTLSINKLFNVKSLNGKILKYYPFLEELFWIDEDGLQRIQLSIFKDQKAGFDLKDREYFTRIRDGSYWRQRSEREFYLQSILSWSSATNQAAVSIPVKAEDYGLEKLKAVALTTNLHSLIEVAMPMNYGFCIFDEQGRVLFHHQRNKNLQQDLKNDLRNFKTVQSAISSRKEASFSTRYEDTDHRFYIRSLPQLPLYLATFHNLEAEKEKLNIVNFLTFSVLLAGTLFFWLLVGITSVFNYRKSNTGQKLVHLNCLTPNLLNKPVYRWLSYFYLLLAFSIVLLVLLDGSFLREDFMDKVFGYLMFIGLSYLLNSLLIEEENYQPNHRKVVLFINLFIILLLATRVALVYSLSLLVIFLVAYLFLKKFKKQAETEKLRKEPYHQYYYQYVFAWLINITVIPVCIIFFTSFNLEERIWSMYQQKQYAQQVQQRDLFINKYYQAIEIQENITDRRKSKGLYTNLNDSKCRVDILHFDRLINNPRLANSISGYLNVRPNFQTTVIRNHRLLYHLLDSTGPNSDPTLQWKLCDTVHQSGSPNLHFRFRDFSDPQSGTRIYTSAIPYFKPDLMVDPEMWEEFILLLLIGCLVLTFIYQEIRFSAKKILAFDFPEVLLKSNSLIMEALTKPQHKIMIISLPYSGINKLLQDYIIIDFLETSNEKEYEKVLKKIKSGSRTKIWLKHFDYQYENPVTNRRKLEIIEKCTRFPELSIVITSTVYPQQIVEYYDKLLERETDSQQILQLKNDRDCWSYLLYDFKKYNYSFSYFPRLKEENIKDFIHNECRHGNFLKSLENQLLEIYRDHLKLKNEEKNFGLIREEIATDLKNMANPYYSNLWYSCSMEERYLLFDLASDGFINSKNKEGVLNLLGKGLLKYREEIQDHKSELAGLNDRLAIMNESFRYFILTSLKPREVEKMEKEQQKLSNWSGIRTVLIIIVIGLTVFITFAQQNVLSSIQTIIAALGSILLVFTQLGNLFSFNFKSSKANKPPAPGV